jgi:nucleoside-diphosphate-sugar epimerase
MKNILVLGSKGQVGISLVKFLKDKNYIVHEFDLIDGDDLRVKNILDDLLKKIDFVFFLAFDVGGSKYLKEFEKSFEFIDNNIKIMSYTFESLKKYKTPFIFTSSQMSNMNYSPYGVLKRIGEFYTNSLGGINVKFWNVYGYEEDESKFHVVTDFLKMSKNDGHIKMKTSGNELRQFLHSDDCSEALEIVMNNYKTIDRGESIDITSFEWSTIKTVGEIISKINNCSLEIGEEIDLQRDKQNEPNRYILNFWSPKINLSTGIKKINDLI